MIENKTIHAVIFKGDDSGYVCTSPDIPIVTQGASLNETVSNLREAIALHFEGENPAEMGYVDNPEIPGINIINAEYTGS